jgi:hypothetical protein
VDQDLTQLDGVAGAQHAVRANDHRPVGVDAHVQQ